ncbi:hypothetical protein C5167_041658 [Papaver somniferum]|nr:hypothetical protein C5167_041658 [Papaver somniferum]
MFSNQVPNKSHLSTHRPFNLCTSCFGFILMQIVTGKASNSANTIPVLPLCLSVSRNRVLICGYSSHWQPNTRVAYVYLDSFRSPLFSNVKPWAFGWYLEDGVD